MDFLRSFLGLVDRVTPITLLFEFAFGKHLELTTIINMGAPRLGQEFEKSSFSDINDISGGIIIYKETDSKQFAQIIILQKKKKHSAIICHFEV